MFFLVIAAFIVIFAGSVLLLKWYAEKVLYLMTNNRHGDSDFLIHTGLAPETWKKRLVFKIGLLISENIAHKLAMKRITALSNYYARTPLVDSEESRKAILKQFSELKDKWGNLTWKELFLPKSM
ncbi:MAG: hypothetical protein HQ557_03485 [Bacteroidetes bacterium]|nr:hypothetical protein [Bacteroidota bacterium]